MANNIGPTIEKILSDLRNKLRRQTASVEATEEHIRLLETQHTKLPLK